MACCVIDYHQSESYEIALKACKFPLQTHLKSELKPYYPYYHPSAFGDGVDAARHCLGFPAHYSLLPSRSLFPSTVKCRLSLYKPTKKLRSPMLKPLTELLNMPKACPFLGRRNRLVRNLSVCRMPLSVSISSSVGAAIC
jgi:hypothetical protein